MDGTNFKGHFTNMGNQVARHCQNHKSKGDGKIRFPGVNFSINV